MPNAITLEVDASKAFEALDNVQTLIDGYMDEAAHVTAEALQRTAAVLVNRRGPNPTAAQQARPPLEDYIKVERPRSGKGWVVIVHNPEGEFEGETLLLSWWLSKRWAHNRQPNPFLWTAQQVETPAHRDRMLDAVERAISDAGLGG